MHRALPGLRLCLGPSRPDEWHHGRYVILDIDSAFSVLQGFPGQG